MLAELLWAFLGRPCGPANSASYYVRPARGDVPPPVGCFRPGALRVVSPRPGPAGPGSLDAVRRDLAGHGCLEEGGRGARDLRSACTRGPSAASGRPLVPCDHGVMTKGDALQLCCLGSGRGRVCALRRNLVIKLVKPICQLPLGKTGAHWTTKACWIV